MRFAIAGEGLTDFIVLQNLLRGFFNDKNLPVSRLHPDNTEPAGWGNLFNYLSTDKFKEAIDNTDYAIVQIDSGTCQDWNENIIHIGSDPTLLTDFIQSISQTLIKKIGDDFYNPNKEKIIFAVTVHDIECWLLPFNANLPAHRSKVVGCVNAIEQIANQQGFSINQKNYQQGKHYETLSKDMRKQKDLMNKYVLNPSLKTFIASLLAAFPPPAIEEPAEKAE